MSVRQFIEKQFIDIIQWTESQDGILAYRFPVRDMEIQNGAQLTVRESQMVLFVNEGRIADVFGPGSYTLNTRNLPILTDLLNWTKEFESPFKSDVYFYSTRLQLDQRWGTATPIAFRDSDFGAVRVRGYGIYSYRVADPRSFYKNVSGTRDEYYVVDLEGQLRNTIVARMTDVFAPSNVSFLDMAANQAALGRTIAEKLEPVFHELGLELASFVVENVSLPDELQKILDQRIGMGMIPDMKRYTEFQVAQSIPLAAANEGGGSAAVGVGVGAGAAIGQTIFNALRPDGSGPAASAHARFCIECGKPLPDAAKFCPDCGKPLPH